MFGMDAKPSPTSLRLRVLGSPSIEQRGQPIVLPAKAVALLAYLALHRPTSPRARLIGLLWPESGDEAGRKNLRNLLWTIHKVLGEEAIEVTGEQLGLRESVWVDLRAFEAAAPENPAAADLYTGPFLDGLSVADAPDFELWLAGQRDRLARLQMRLLLTQLDQDRVKGDWRRVIDTARRALAVDRLDESFYRALMRAHARLGERAEALHQYETLRAALERELGARPSPETEALRNAIARGDHDPARHPRRLPRAPGSLARASAEVPFVGRRAERAALDRALELVRGGRAQAALVTGELGIGKSRLWETWSATLSTEVTALETRCLDVTRALPFAPLAELLARPPYLERLVQPSSPLAPVWLAEVARLLPQIRQTRSDLPPTSSLPPEEERRRVFEALTQSILALRGQDLVLYLDDAHWADGATLDWLGYLLHRLRDESVFLVVAYRPEQAPSSLVNLATTWGRDGIAHHIPLGRLRTDEAAELITALGATPDAAQNALERSAGNPYFLVELVRSGSPDIPPVLAELLRARLERLAEPVRQVVQAAAVLEPEVDLPTLRKASGLGEEDLLDALDNLVANGILVEESRGYAFTHPLLPVVARLSLSSARRAFVARHAADALAQTSDRDLPALAGRLTALYEDAGEIELAAHFADLAAAHGLGVAAPAEAAELARRALALAPTPTRHATLGKILFRLGDLASALGAYEAALSGFEAAGDGNAAARVCLGMAETSIQLGKLADVSRWTSRTLALLDHDGDSASHALAHLLLGTALMPDGESLALGEDHLREAEQIALANNLPDLAARARFILGNLQAERGDLTAAVESYREGVLQARAAGDQTEEALYLNNTAYHRLLLGDLTGARASAEEGLALATRWELSVPLQYLYSTRGELALADGALDEAAEWLGRGLAEALRQGNGEQAANCRALLALVARRRGDLDGAVLELEATRSALADSAGQHLRSKLDLWLAETYLERGERAAAAQALSRAEPRLAGSNRRQLQEWAARLRQELAQTPAGP
jgi:DNA-binding SARP family transcriptional activator